MKRINLTISRESAEELADLKIELGFLKPEERDTEIDRLLKQKLGCLFG